MAKTGRPVLALIDGDTIAFRAAAAVEHQIEWPTGLVEKYAIKTEGEQCVDSMLRNLSRRLGYDAATIFVSAPSVDNWRLKVDPTYKSNRAGKQLPFLLTHLKQYLRRVYGAKHLGNLEADDAIGISGTTPNADFELLIVGRDKDFLTIPGRHYQLGDDVLGVPDIKTVTPKQAELNHFVQCLAGDRVDGYPGCPGFGMKTAKEVVENPTLLIPKTRKITRGKDKGKDTIGWHEAGPCSIWEAVVCRYEAAGLTEEDALKTGRLAKILHAKDYNMETKEVTLWTPNRHA